MEIKILMTKGCTGCAAFYETASRAAKELDSQIVLVKADNITDILTYSVLKLPAVVIKEKVVHSGKKLSLEEMKKLFLDNLKTEE